jgi:hypothetical protein
MDQKSDVLHLRLKGLSAHVIHDDLVAILGPKAVAYRTVTPYLREAKLCTAEVTLDSEQSSPSLDDSDRDTLAALEEQKSRFRLCENLPEPHICYARALPSMEGSPNRSDPCDVFFAG